MSTYRRVQECSEMEKRRVREGSVMHRRAALYTGGQSDCAQEGSVIAHRRVAGLCAGG